MDDIAVSSIGTEPAHCTVPITSTVNFRAKFVQRPFYITEESDKDKRKKTMPYKVGHTSAAFMFLSRKLTIKGGKPVHMWKASSHVKST
jgi:hypothetical protein